MTRRSSAAALLALLLVVSMSAANAEAKKPRVPRGKTWAVDFRADTLGLAPAGSVVMGGSWAVLEDSIAATSAVTGGDVPPAPPRLLRQRANDDAVASNWIRFPKPSLENCEVSVRFRIVSGELDPGVGIVFQYDAKRKTGYLVRLSGAEEEIVAHYFLSGKRRDIKMESMPALAPGGWHTLAIRRDRSTMTILVDGKERMSLRDERFARGEVGLWTEDDTVADFADLTITAR